MVALWYGEFAAGISFCVAFAIEELDRRVNSNGGIIRELDECNLAVLKALISIVAGAI